MLDEEGAGPIRGNMHTQHASESSGKRGGANRLCSRRGGAGFKSHGRERQTDMVKRCVAAGCTTPVAMMQVSQ